MNGDEPLVVFVTAASPDQAQSIARVLVEEKLAACVNIIPSIRSIYMWEGALCDEAETLMIIKTRSGRFDDLQARILAIHSYNTPEIIALPVSAGFEGYLEWVRQNTRPQA